MFQFLGPKRENDIKPASARQAGRDADKTGKLLEGVEIVEGTQQPLQGAQRPTALGPIAALCTHLSLPTSVFNPSLPVLVLGVKYGVRLGAF